MKSANEWNKEGVFKVLGMEDRAGGNYSLLLSEDEGEGGREDRASLKKKPVTFGMEDGESRREDKASLDKKPVLPA
eukprot:1402961-Ditylum_brightwellii.AAC.1